MAAIVLFIINLYVIVVNLVSTINLVITHDFPATTGIFTDFTIMLTPVAADQLIILNITLTTIVSTFSLSKILCIDTTALATVT